MKATLPCPHKTGDVIWSWLNRGNGNPLTLVTTENGKVNIIDKRFAFGSDNSLVIENVTTDLERMYLCNNYRIYLKVMKDPNKLDPEAGYKPVTQRNKGQGVDSGQEGTTAKPENQPRSDFWKVPVGVAVAAALVLLATITLIHFFKNREKRTPNDDEAEPEQIYEEMTRIEHQPGRESRNVSE
ncbi:Proline-rich receptor-like protein kinase PERK2 [Dissostichus eleginoides]|uniref:Proline-rich receptor-like protein kinase PERK2 n=1 Tax=Dissostichus eleginoides TaxID=100907 RepID=A0AAD9BP96_DISEL|nr:Proline-rich receptor-like protein kinase PERK2 [Dissostichus eleginoides]